MSEPHEDSETVKSGYWANSRGGSAACGIVRFSTKRSGEIGRLPMEWSKCLIPLVNSKKVKVLGRCVAAPASLSMMQEIMLYISFYIHHSIFTSLKMELVHGKIVQCGLQLCMLEKCYFLTC
ncbi:putative HIRAN domain-containing protein [Helianthus annuus]|nr:putative HIRAN domain-containing protein [Helianthus annuus]